MYKALNVPPSRLESDSGFSLGRESEINRDEMKFSKFVSRLRNKFTEMFDQVLKTQLVLKGILKQDDWDKFRPQIQYSWAEDSYYREIKKSEMLAGRLNILRDISEYAGRYFSMDWIRRELLAFTDEEVTTMDKEIAAEVSDERLAKDATIEWGATDTNFDPETDGADKSKTAPKRDPKEFTRKPNANGSNGSSKSVYAGLDPENEESLNSINSLFDELDHIGTEEELNE